MNCTAGYLLYYVSPKFAAAIVTRDRSGLTEEERTRLDAFLELVKSHARGVPGAWEVDPGPHYKRCHVGSEKGHVPCAAMYWVDAAPMPLFA